MLAFHGAGTQCDETLDPERQETRKLSCIGDKTNDVALAESEEPNAYVKIRYMGDITMLSAILTSPKMSFGIVTYDTNRYKKLNMHGIQTN